MFYAEAPDRGTEVLSQGARHCSADAGKWSSCSLRTIRMVLGGMLSPSLSCADWTVSCHVAQQLSRHVPSRSVSRHFEEFNPLGATILVATTCFCDSGENLFLPFLCSPGLMITAEYFLLRMAFWESTAHREFLPMPLTGKGFGCRRLGPGVNLAAGISPLGFGFLLLRVWLCRVFRRHHARWESSGLLLTNKTRQR